MNKNKGLKSTQEKTSLKPNNTIKRLPRQLLKKALRNAYGMWGMYTKGYLFFIRRRNKYTEYAKGYFKLIREYECRIDDVIEESERCDYEASEYLKGMKQARNEITQLEERGGYSGR